MGLVEELRLFEKNMFGVQCRLVGNGGGVLIGGIFGGGVLIREIFGGQVLIGGMLGGGIAIEGRFGGFVFTWGIFGGGVFIRGRLGCVPIGGIFRKGGCIGGRFQLLGGVWTLGLGHSF